MLWRFFDAGQATLALRRPGFRWYLVGRVSGAGSGHLRSVVQGWLVYQMTGSVLALGWLMAAGMGAQFALTLFGGVMSDRVDKRRVMLIARLILVVVSLTTALLLTLKALSFWYLVVAVMIENAVFAFKDPAENAIVAELVDRRALLNAVSLATTSRAWPALPAQPLRHPDQVGRTGQCLSGDGKPVFAGCFRGNAVATQCHISFRPLRAV